MERIRLTGRLLLPLMLLFFAGGAIADDTDEVTDDVVVQQPSAEVAPHTAPPPPQTTQIRSRRIGSQQLAAPATSVEFTTVDQQKLAENNAAASAGTPTEVGVVKPLGIDVDLRPLNVAAMEDQTYGFLGGLVQRAPDQVTWVIRLDALGSGGTRLLIEHCSLPEGAGIFVYNHAGDERGPYQCQPDGFWTQSIAGEQIYVQVDVPEQSADAVRFRLSAMMLLDASSIAFCPKNAPCVEDASCHGPHEWSELDKARKAVAHINYIKGAASYMCSGGLLRAKPADSAPIIGENIENAEHAETPIPYFLTSNQCVDSPEVAATVETWFNYQTDICNGACTSRPYASSTFGASLIHHSPLDDHSLLRLDQAPPADAEFLDWSATPVAFDGGTMLYRLSHPQGSPQAYSTHRIDTTISPAGFCQTVSKPRGPYIFSRNVVGATEEGSAGAPVIQENGQVVGQLFGICGLDPSDVCDAENNATVDGAFANYFPDVAPWLQPDPLALPLTVQKLGTGKGRVVSSLEDDPADPNANVMPVLAGGTKISQTDWPWQAALSISTWRVNGKWTCGGSVIASKWVLTAAHCIVDKIDVDDVGGRLYHPDSTVAPANIQVRVGFDQFEFGGQVTGVKRIVKHPEFRVIRNEEGAIIAFDHDIALLELKEPVFVEPIRPVTLEREAKLACIDTKGTVTGWKTTDLCGQDANLLSKVNTILANPSRCRTDYPASIATGNMLCTTPGADNGAQCQFDDGSPLAVSTGRGGYVQAGIVSWGNGCATSAKSTVYTRLANYVGWMEGMTGLDLTSATGPGIIDCGSTCRTTYASGTALTLTATAAPGSVFVGWSGACDGTKDACQLNMSEASNVKAIFNSLQPPSRTCR